MLPCSTTTVCCYSIRLPQTVASWVNYSRQRIESSREHYDSDLSLLKVDALWCENKQCLDSNPCPVVPLHHSTSELPLQTDIITDVDFIPFAIETSGVWGVQALGLVSKIGRRLTSTTHEPRSTTFLRQCIVVAVMRGNAQCVLGTLQSSNCCDI